MPTCLLRTLTVCILCGTVVLVVISPSYAADSSASQVATLDEESDVDSDTDADANGEAEDADDNLPVAGHSDHGEAFNEGPRQNAYLMGGTGKVDFPVTTKNKQAQAFFDQGLGQLYGFWYYEAERSFRRVAALDPDCAMAYWGMAQANEENKERAKSFITEAVERKDNASDREQMYITALEKYLNDDGEEKDYRKAYTKALEKIIRKFPTDVEAKAMLAVHLWQSDRHGVPITSHQAIESLLGDVFRVEPMHSAHHFRIHLWDREEPAQALESAAKCGQTAPSIAHMWHMPGHIYSRLHRYHDAVFQQEASARSDHAHMMRDGVLPDQIHNYAHNNEWLIRNLVHLGRKDDALSLAKNMLELPRHPKYNAFDKSGMCSCKYGRRRLLQVLETFEMWNDVFTLSETMYLEPTDSNEEQGKRLRMIGLAHYHRGDSSELKECVESLRDLLQKFDSDAKKKGKQAAEKKRKELENEGKEKEKKEEAQKEEATAEGKEEGKGDASEGEDDEKEVESNKDEGAKAEDKKAEDKLQKERDKKIQGAKKKAERDARKGKKSVGKAIAELEGLQFLAKGDTDAAIEQFKTSDIPKSRLAVYYFLAGDHEKSTKLCEEMVKSGENEVRPLAVQVDLLRRMGKKDEAKSAFEKLRTVAGAADLETPLLAKLAKFAKEQKWPKDWRTPEEIPEDVGKRPKLDSLGPFRWGPSPAADWELPGPKKQNVVLADYRGRPVVVIFYLGAGCLHCVEQLHEFTPLLPKFEKAGIEVVAISSEAVADLVKSVKNFSKEGAFPMRLVANPELDVFKEYRAYDDFEKMPLHGTFLIDAKGMVRWRDVSYEPFLDAEFLLRESQRVLK